MSKSAINNPFLTELKDKNGESWYHQIILDKKDKEIERLNNIINELEKWLSARIDNFNANVSEPIYHEYIAIRLVYDYLQDLKGDGSNE